MAASVETGDSEFSTTNVFKCSKCPYSVENVEKIKAHIASCNNEEGEEEGSMYNSQDNSMSRVMSFDMYPDEDNTPSFQFSHDATVQLLQYLKVELKAAKTIRTASMFGKIAKRLVAYGYPVTQAQCDVKWRNLKKNYVRVKAKSEQRGFHYKKRSWRYYEAVEELVKLWDLKKGTSASQPVRLEPTGSEINSESDNMDDSDPNEPPELKKMKLSHQQPKWFRDFRKECERRHKERQAISTRLTNTLEKFIERVNCKCYKKWK